jgi:hypothetical protein
LSQISSAVGIISDDFFWKNHLPVLENILTGVNTRLEQEQAGIVANVDEAVENYIVQDSDGIFLFGESGTPVPRQPGLTQAETARQLIARFRINCERRSYQQQVDAQRAADEPVDDPADPMSVPKPPTWMNRKGELPKELRS